MFSYLSSPVLWILTFGVIAGTVLTYVKSVSSANLMLKHLLRETFGGLGRLSKTLAPDDKDAAMALRRIRRTAASATAERAVWHLVGSVVVLVGGGAIAWLSLAHGGEEVSSPDLREAAGFLAGFEIFRSIGVALWMSHRSSEAIRASISENLSRTYREMFAVLDIGQEQMDAAQGRAEARGQATPLSRALSLVGRPSLPSALWQPASRRFVNRIVSLRRVPMGGGSAPIMHEAIVRTVRRYHQEEKETEKRVYTYIPPNSVRQFMTSANRWAVHRLGRADLPATFRIKPLEVALLSTVGMATSGLPAGAERLKRLITLRQLEKELVLSRRARGKHHQRRSCPRYEVRPPVSMFHADTQITRLKKQKFIGAVRVWRLDISQSGTRSFAKKEEWDRWMKFIASGRSRRPPERLDVGEHVDLVRRGSSTEPIKYRVVSEEKNHPLPREGDGYEIHIRADSLGGPDQALLGECIDRNDSAVKRLWRRLRRRDEFSSRREDS